MASIPAHAWSAQLLLTFAGYVDSLSGDASLVGSPHLGDAGSVNYLIDYPPTGVTVIPGMNSVTIMGSGASSPAIARLNVGGVETIFGSVSSSIAKYDNVCCTTAQDGLFLRSNQLLDGFNTFIDSELRAPTLFSSLNLSETLSYTPVTGDTAYSKFFFSNGSGYSLIGSLKVTHVSLSLVGSSVPEPQSWMLMMLGIGLVGGSLRCARRGRPVPVAAG